MVDVKKLSPSPLESLRQGNWFKLICGASFQDLPTIRSLSLVYTLAGADCLDLAADEAVIIAAQEGVKTAQSLGAVSSPFHMVSINTGEDPHFRKAFFNPALCPPDCQRPCETICPAQAIHAEVITQRCYGCGRCLPVCPEQIITTQARILHPPQVMELVKERGIDALEIHTQVGHGEDFQKLWQAIAPHSHHLKLLAISCQDHKDLLEYLYYINKTIQPLPCPLVWQTDGRPMSGDIGKGTTHSTIRMAEKVLKSSLPGYIQLAGGTNAHTVEKLKNLHLREAIAGIAYGSYPRSQLLPILDGLEKKQKRLEDCPELLRAAVRQAQELVATLKD
jgi:Fe-S-cluster-containing hydrogenase component 2